MRFNKLSLLSLIFLFYVATTNGALISAPNPRLGFPSRTKSVANALYSAVEWPLATFPNEQIADEVKTMKRKIRVQSRDQFLNVHPGAEMGYNVVLTKKQ